MKHHSKISAAILALVATACTATISAQRTDHMVPEPLQTAPAVVEEYAMPSLGVGRELPAETEPVEPEPLDLGTFKLTAYCPCPACCGEWADGITYTGTTATQGRTIAVDPDVIPLGSSVEIAGHTYIAEDIGGAIQGNRIDVYFRNHAEALQFGVQYATVLLNTK